MTTKANQIAVLEQKLAKLQDKFDAVNESYHKLYADKKAQQEEQLKARIGYCSDNLKRACIGSVLSKIAVPTMAFEVLASATALIFDFNNFLRDKVWNVSSDRKIKIRRSGREQMKLWGVSVNVYDGLKEQLIDFLKSC